MLALWTVPAEALGTTPGTAGHKLWAPPEQLGTQPMASRDVLYPARISSLNPIKPQPSSSLQGASKKQAKPASNLWGSSPTLPQVDTWQGG